MRLGVFVSIALLGCSACSLPSLPSIPWTSAPAKVDPTAEALYEQGLRAFDEKKYVRAIDSFSKLRTDYPFSPLVTQAELKIADAYYLNRQYPEAINAFKEFQSMHPTHEKMPFVTLRLGQAHFDQFTSADRDQKNTELAKGYFDTVIAKYPKSPEAAEARAKLAKAIEYLAEHEFNVAYFYYQQQKYPAARDRFEEIVRKYKDTPTAVKSLFYLGESYRNEKNVVRASLAYEALVQHYPQSQFASEARAQLAQLGKEKHDPLAMLLMRDRRPGAGPAPEVKEDPALAKLKDANWVAKAEVVYEEPGAEKGFFRRVAEKLNPFSSSDSNRKSEEKNETAMEVLAKRQAQKKEPSGGFFASLWPFGSKESKAAPRATDPKSNTLMSQLDSSLKQKGIDVAADQSALKPPAADLPKEDEKPKAQPAVDTLALLSSIDANLGKSGKKPDQLPPPPEPAEGLKNLAATQERLAKANQSQAQQDIQTSGILSSVDQKLKARGVEPSQFEKPPTPEEIKAAERSRPNNVELEPKLALEKGPLFLNPAEASASSARPNEPKDSATATAAHKAESADAPGVSPSRVLVAGPVEPQLGSGIKPGEPKRPATAPDDEPKGALEQIRQNLESVGKVLNPFSW